MGNNSDEHCFVLKDLVPSSKMHVAGKNFGKICLKAITDTFFQYVVFDQGRDWGLDFLMEGCNQEKEKVETFWLVGGVPHYDFLPQWDIRISP